jgi:hypothetical protein
LRIATAYKNTFRMAAGITLLCLLGGYPAPYLFASPSQSQIDADTLVDVLLAQTFSDIPAVPSQGQADPNVPANTLAAQAFGNISTAQPQDKIVQNVWVDIPLTQIFRDISTQTGAMIAVCSHVPDQLVSLDIGDGRPLQKCLQELVAGRGLVVFQKSKHFYLVSCGSSSCPSFMEVADSQRIYLKYINAKGLMSSLPRPMQSYVSVGERTNEVFVYAACEVMENIKKMVNILDIPQQQVVLEVLVVELWDSASDEFGLDWGFQDEHTEVAMTEGLGYFTGLARYTSVPQNAMSGVFLTLRSLVAKERADVRARPRVATLNGQSASIDISLDEYFTIVTDAYGPNALLRTELQVIKSGIQLNITPNIGEKGDITVDVITEVSDVAERQNQIQGNESGNLPLVKRRKVDTNVRVKDGDAIIIGGLVETQQKSIDKRVPVLSSIPLVGGLFTAKESSTVNKEVVIFITPRIMQEGRIPFAERNSKVNVTEELQQLRETSPTAKDKLSQADLNEAAGKKRLQNQPQALLDEMKAPAKSGDVPAQVPEQM